jgi:putative DNA-invertase from lambdoid prophage Rac
VTAKGASETAKPTRVFGQRKEAAKMFRAGLYARVSTQDQQTLPLQMRAMREYAAKRGWAIAVQIKEVGSGAAERELREKLLAAARHREIDAVLVWRLDRWGRSLVDLVVTLRELAELGVAFVSLTEALDLTTPTGRAMAGLLSVFAAFEHDILSERIRAGIAEARLKGKHLGRPVTVGKHASQIRKLHRTGVSKAEIARRLDMDVLLCAGNLRPKPRRRSLITEDLSMDRVTVGITIESTILTPEQISQRIGIVGDEVRRIGDPRGHTGQKWDRNVWRIFERRKGALNTGANDLLPVCVAAFVQRLIPIAENLREVSATEGGEFFITVSAQSVPGINLPPDTLRAIADTKLSLDVDIILYASEES